MAALDSTARLRCRIGLIRQFKLTEFDKPTLDAAIAACDDWIDENQASFNSSLPNSAPAQFRSNATLQQKTLLFCIVAMRRAGILKIEEDNI